MLRWKMGANALKNEAKGQKVEELKTLWEHYKEVFIGSIVLPEEEDEPAVPAIQNTCLGDASTNLLEGAATPWIDNSRRDSFVRLLMISQMKAAMILVFISFLDIGITYLF
jgi:hypothetical protein